MAYAYNAVFEVRTTGSDANAGGFVPGGSGTDYSQQDAAQASGVFMSVHASTNTDVLPNGLTPAAAHVGNIIRITAGTGWTAGWYQIMSIQSGYWRLDRSPGAVGISGGSWVLGGALATPGMASAAMANGQSNSCTLIFLKPGTYTMTVSSANVSGGRLSPPNYNVMLIGYSTNRHVLNTDTRPVISAGAVTGITMAYNVHAVNVEFDGNGGTGNKGVDGGYVAYRCHFKNFRGVACTGSSAYCTATGCYAACFQGSSHYYSVAYANSCPGVTGAFNGYALANGCIAYSNGGADRGGGFMPNGSGMTLNCVSYANHTGFYNFNWSGAPMFENCVAVNNSAYGFRSNGYGLSRWFRRCAAFNSPTNYDIAGASAPLPGYDNITLTANPFVDPANGNFSLNDIAGGGADLKSAGVPGALPGWAVGTVHYPDIGAVRHQDPAAGGGGVAGGAFTYVG